MGLPRRVGSLLRVRSTGLADTPHTGGEKQFEGWFDLLHCFLGVRRGFPILISRKKGKREYQKSALKTVSSEKK